jgi:hypothetical protein
LADGHPAQADEQVPGHAFWASMAVAEDGASAPERLYMLKAKTPTAAMITTPTMIRFIRFLLQRVVEKA